MLCRGGRIRKTPKKRSDYKKKAWYTYADKSCKYDCQVTEYLWWGYVAYSGIGNGMAGVPEWTKEFHVLNKKKFTSKDTALTKLFRDSENKTAVYRLPTKPVDGTYTGCNKCSSGKNHGGK